MQTHELDEALAFETCSALGSLLRLLRDTGCDDEELLESIEQTYDRIVEKYFKENDDGS